MAVGFITIDLYPASDVATDGTMDFPYPSGYDAAADFAQSGEILIVSGLGNVLEQAADTFTVAYDGNSATVTYEDATTIPAGTKVTLQLPLADYAPLTDSSGGTASNTVPAIGATYSQTEVRNALATITAKLNKVIALSKARDNIPNDDRN